MWLNRSGFDQVRYLEAKRGIDDRSLNRHVWARLVDEVSGLGRSGEPLRVLEVGAGVGTMVERLVDWELFAGVPDVEVTLVDAHAPSIERARRRVAELDLRAEAVVGDALAIDGGPWDLLVACAFLDLVHLPTALPHLAGLMRAGGLLWLPLCYDGETAFEPVPDPDVEAEVLDRYHRSMDERRVEGRPSGDSRTGRHLPAALRGAGLEVLAGPEGYPGDEAYFLHCILDLVGGAAGDEAQMVTWCAARHEAVEHGELLYLAHQLDALARVP